MGETLLFASFRYSCADTTIYIDSYRKVGVLLVRCDQFTYQQFRIPVLQRALLV